MYSHIIIQSFNQFSYKEKKEDFVVNAIPFTNWFSDFGFIINSPLSSLKKRGVYCKIRKPIKIVHIVNYSLPEILS